MFDTAVGIAIDSAYCCVLYAYIPEKILSKATSYEYIIFLRQDTTQDNYLMLWNSNEDTAKTLLRLLTHC